MQFSQIHLRTEAISADLLRVRDILFFTMANDTSTSTTDPNESPSNESFMQRVTRATKNLGHRVRSFCSNTKEDAHVKKLEYDIAQRKKTFGVTYLDLLDKKATDEELKECINAALEDVGKLKDKMQGHSQNKEKNKEELQRRIQEAKKSPAKPSAQGEETKEEDAPEQDGPRTKESEAPSDEPKTNEAASPETAPES
jgi:hypothetical protein